MVKFTPDEALVASYIGHEDVSLLDWIGKFHDSRSLHGVSLYLFLPVNGFFKIAALIIDKERSIFEQRYFLFEEEDEPVKILFGDEHGSDVRMVEFEGEDCLTSFFPFI